jgi:hypothetical protein
MNKYCYAILREINSVIDSEDVSDKVTVETVIADLFEGDFGEDMNEYTWVECMIRLELLYGFEIPDELAQNHQLTIRELSEKLAQLSCLPDAVYPEFIKIKSTMLTDFPRLIMIEEGIEQAEPGELEELKRRLAYAEKRRLDITGEH